jgi:hypothetical protein
VAPTTRPRTTEAFLSLSGTLLLNQVAVCTHTGASLDTNYPRLTAYLRQRGAVALSCHPAWLTLLCDGLGHVPYCLESVATERTCGVLPLAFVYTWLFGQFLVSLPFLNSDGVVADPPVVAHCLPAPGGYRGPGRHGPTGRQNS